MDRNLVERMIGAGVLVLLLVLLVPTLLDGSRDDEMAPANVTLPETVLRTETIYLNGTEPPPAVPDQGAAKTQADLPPLARIQPAGAKPERRPAPVAASTSAPTAVSAEASEATSDQWGVQLGSFSNRENANRMVNDLVDQGFPAHVSVTSSGGRSMYRVRVGPRPSRDSAAELARTLAAAGHGGMVMALADEPGE
jgi:cell division septation protein DedD